MRYEVPGMTLVAQEFTMSCWYASAQMLIRWKCEKFQMSLKDLVPPELDKECQQVRDGDQGIRNPQILPMAQRLGLLAVPPMSPSPDAIGSWLQQHGPLWVNGNTHIVVIAGIDGDDSVKVYDPAPVNTGQIEWRSLTTWYGGDSTSARDISQGVDTVFLYCP